MSKQLKIINADRYVNELSPDSEQMLMAVIEFIDAKSTVLLHETLHGHIATIDKKEGRFVPGCEGQPARLGVEEMAFFTGLYGFRWVEACTGKIVIGFTNKAAQ